jgi:hypothetical protein
MERCDYEGAVQSFEHARAQLRPFGDLPLLVVSLVSLLMGVLQRIEITHQLTDIRMEI